MHTALAATSQTIVDFLRQRLEGDADLAAMFDPAAGGTMVVSLSDPKEFATQQLEGLSVWLYRLVRDEERLNAPPLRESPRDRRLPPLPLRLHYLMTPIVRPATPNGPRLKQTVLGKVLQALYDHPRFCGADLRGDLTGTTQDLNVRLEPMTLEDIARVWNVEQSYHLSASFEVSVVEIRSERVEPVAAALVAETRTGIIVGLEES